MKWLACILIVGVTLRHFTNSSIGAETYLGPKGWFYVMGGLWEVLLCSALFAMVWESKKTKWRWAALYGLVVGASEALQMAACRSLIADISKLRGNACDFVSGLHVTMAFNVLYVVLGGILIGVMLRESANR